MLSIANEIDSLIFRCVCFVCNTNYVFPITTWRFNRFSIIHMEAMKNISCIFSLCKNKTMVGRGDLETRKVV